MLLQTLSYPLISSALNSKINGSLKEVELTKSTYIEVHTKTEQNLSDE